MQIRNNLEEQTPSGHWDRANFDSWLMLFYNNVAQKRHNYGHKLFAHFAFSGCSLCTLILPRSFTFRSLQ